jgi:hypothetical protein
MVLYVLFMYNFLLQLFIFYIIDEQKKIVYNKILDDF